MFPNPRSLVTSQSPCPSYAKDLLLLTQHVKNNKNVPKESLVSQIVSTRLEKEVVRATSLSSNGNTRGSSNLKDLCLLRQYIKNCEIVSQDNFVLQVVLARLEKEVVQVTALSSNGNTCKSSNVKDLFLLRQYLKNCENVPQDNFVSQIVLARLDEEATHMKSSSVECPKNDHKIRSSLLSMLKFLFFDSSLALLFVCFLISCFVQFGYHAWIIPIMEAANWADTNRLQHEFTYYERQCDASDITTRSTKDLLLTSKSSSEDAAHSFMTHGMSFFPKVLTEETAAALRTHILKQNHKLTPDDFIPLDGPENRYSYGIGANEHPSVVTALKEIQSNTLLRSSLEKMLGPNPAVAEITAITALYGAENQGWHSDVKAAGNSVKYSRTFTHSYSLFIPLQNVTEEMGATEVCPGTQFCPNDLEDTCLDVGFPAAGNDAESVWKVGDALVMNQCMWHRGRAHTDPNGAERVVFILTFLSRPNPGVDHRQLSHGTYFHMRPDMYGFTLNDLKNPEIVMKPPFSWMRSLGVWKPLKAQWGWDWLTMTALRISNNENGYQYDDMFFFMQQSSIGKALPEFLHGRVSEEGGWQMYLSETISNITVAFGVIYLLAAGGYFSVALLSDFLSKTRSHYFRSLLLRTFVLDMILLLVAYNLQHQVFSSPWGKSIKSKTIFSHPFSVKLTSGLKKDVNLTATTVPEKLDILFGNRFDSKFIGYYRHFLDYHPGNVQFNNQVELQGDNYNSYSGLPRQFQYYLTERIISNIQQTGARFLLQNDFGEWTMMKKREVERVVVKKLLKKEHRIFSVLDDELALLISNAREKRVISMGLDNLLKWRQAIEGIYLTETKIKRKKKRATQKLLQSLFQLEVFNPLDITLTRIERRKIPQVDKSREFMIKKGDKVYAKYPDSRDCYIAEVVRVEFGRRAVIKSNGYRSYVHLNELRPFRPLTEGDSVEFLMKEMWNEGVISRAYPDRTYDIKLSNDNAASKIPFYDISMIFSI